MKRVKNFLSLLLVIAVAVFIYTNQDSASQAAANKSAGSVCVSGESFGIKLYTRGVLVISTAEVKTKSGSKNPGRDAGLKSGDIILEINGKKVSTCAETAAAFEASAGKSVKLAFERDGKRNTVSLKPEFNQNSGTYKAGLWIRDSTAGIGTISFYDKQGRFASLGHGMADVDTGQLMPLGNGEALKSEIVGYMPASKGSPGELYGVLSDTGIGEIKKNVENGIYGISKTGGKNGKFVSVANPDEIKTGEAEIITTISGDKAEKFKAEIVYINIFSSGSKNMIVEITDERLLNKTGGILQGMSGSPIIQNGKFVGALTHVFVNRPNYGYAVFGTEMVKQCQAIK